MPVKRQTRRVGLSFPTPKTKTKVTKAQKTAQKAKKAQERASEWEIIVRTAHLAGMAKALATTPTPMVVGTPTTPFGSDIDPTKTTYYVAGGVCGFASVRIAPARTAFCKWLVETGRARRSEYSTGIYLFCGTDFQDVRVQSYELNCAYAYEYARILTEFGIDHVRVESRLD